jgi:hypothetical protein
MKKLLLAGVAALLTISAAYTADEELPPEASPPVPSIRVTPPPIPPLGWVYNYYAPCADPVPNGYAVMALVNGTPLIPLQKQGDWLLVAPACDLTPTWAWSWNAGVPLNRCWVYF